jgi:hypothetical protein
MPHGKSNLLHRRTNWDAWDEGPFTTVFSTDQLNFNDMRWYFVRIPREPLQRPCDASRFQRTIIRHPTFHFSSARGSPEVRIELRYWIGYSKWLLSTPPYLITECALQKTPGYYTQKLCQHDSQKQLQWMPAFFINKWLKKKEHRWIGTKTHTKQKIRLDFREIGAKERSNWGSKIIERREKKQQRALRKYLQQPEKCGRQKETKVQAIGPQINLSKPRGKSDLIVGDQ